MKLLTNEIKQKLPCLYSQEQERDPMVWVKFFTPWALWTWYIIEWDQHDLFFGLVQGSDTELGYFNLWELEEISGPAGLKIERDINWKPRRLSQVRKELGR